MNQLLCNKNYQNFRKDLKDGGCNSFTVYRDSNGVVHSDGDLDHDSFSMIMKGPWETEVLPRVATNTCLLGGNAAE